jgi:hypothetical protein
MYKREAPCSKREEGARAGGGGQETGRGSGGLVKCLLQQPILCVNNNVFFQRLLPWVRAIEDLIDLFKRPPLSLNEETVDQDTLECVPCNVQEIKLPLDSFPNDWNRICVKERRDVNKKIVHSHSLCSCFVGETFDGVQSLERSVGKRVGYTEEVNCGNGSTGTVIVGVATLAVYGGEHGYGGPYSNEHAGCDKQNGPTAKTVGKAGANSGHDK